MNSQKPVEKSKIKNKPTRNNNKKAAKRIIIALLSIITVTVVGCLALVGAIEHFNQPEESGGETLIFHEADYDFDILTDKGYLELDRNVYFENPVNGITSAIVDGNFDDVPTDQYKFVSLLCDFVKYAINGDSAALNALFSDEYIEADGKTKMEFTMQQLYNIKITYIQTLSEVVDGETYVSNDYWLEYMIRKNNGTFRNDMESDCVKKEYVRVTDRAGDIGIDVLAPYNTQNQNINPIETEKIITVFVISVVLILLVGIGIYWIIKRKK